MPPTPIHAHHANPERPPLALGMLLAHARARLSPDDYDTTPRFLSSSADLEAVDPGNPGVFLFSAYLWNLEAALAMARRVKQHLPGSTTVFGGPSVPAYEGACRDFLCAHPEVDFAVRGEGEETLVALLQHLAESSAPPHGVAGLSFLEGGALVQTPGRVRSAAPDAFPSPYLTGVFDALEPDSWVSATLETNRGCPYRCTFCDWGSATRQKIRTFEDDRVFAEIEWLAERRVPELWIADANFGLLPRDAAIAEHIARVRRRTGYPRRMTVNYAKNTHKHLPGIVRTLVEAGVIATGIVSIQTRDEATLAATGRRNIKPEQYDHLQRTFRDLDLPLATQLMLGLPGSTVSSFKADLRAHVGLDLEVQMFRTAVLPNAPMADPAYLAEHAVRVAEDGLVVSTATFTEADLAHMEDLGRLFRFAQDYGALRHVLAYLQREHGLDPVDVLEDLLSAGHEHPALGALGDWDGTRLDMLTTHVALREERWRHGSWPELYRSLGRFLRARYALGPAPGLDAVLRLQALLMPARGRRLPKRHALPFDVVTWDADHRAGRPRPLADYGPGVLEVSDPWGLCRGGPARRAGRPPTAWELLSPLARRTGQPAGVGRTRLREAA